jgi:hypothetical protein
VARVASFGELRGSWTSGEKERIEVGGDRVPWASPLAGGEWLGPVRRTVRRVNNQHVRYTREWLGLVHWTVRRLHSQPVRCTYIISL